MAYLIDDLLKNQTQVGKRWFVAKPVVGPLISRIKDAWRVITGRYDAVKFAEVEHTKDIDGWVKNVRVLSELDVERAKEAAAEKIFKTRKDVTSFGKLKAPRNQPCPCKSGRRFKNCCGKDEQ